MRYSLESVRVTVYRPAALIVMDDVHTTITPIEGSKKLALITDKMAVLDMGIMYLAHPKWGKSRLITLSNVSVAEHPSAL
ncbi:MAG: hypothetical protein IPO26_20160 [Saprospiraceae bacterium]|nr:hypothetical protein [Saprospiraceae bacterium]